jgi:hypothetical protein
LVRQFVAVEFAVVGTVFVEGFEYAAGYTRQSKREYQFEFASALEFGFRFLEHYFGFSILMWLDG